MTDFQVTLRVSAGRLPTVLEALHGAATLVSVLPLAEAEERPERPKREFHFVGGKRNKGISGADLVVQVLQKRGGQSILAMREFAQAFEQHGFAAQSASSALAECKAKGLVASVSPGHYQLTEKGRETNNA